MVYAYLNLQVRLDEAASLPACQAAGWASLHSPGWMTALDFVPGLERGCTGMCSEAVCACLVCLVPCTIFRVGKFYFAPRWQFLCAASGAHSAPSRVPACVSREAIKVS